MSLRRWQTIKVQYCQRVGKEVSLEAEVAYPPDTMPDQPPRIIAHRCSFGLQCNLDGSPSCVWAGTNPNYDPFEESGEA
ncbi:MAG: hypothetical protein Fur0018_26270 [Anaerolineales bacterium]